MRPWLRCWPKETNRVASSAVSNVPNNRRPSSRWRISTASTPRSAPDAAVLRRWWWQCRIGGCIGAAAGTMTMIRVDGCVGEDGVGGGSAGLMGAGSAEVDENGAKGSMGMRVVAWDGEVVSYGRRPGSAKGNVGLPGGLNRQPRARPRGRRREKGCAAGFARVSGRRRGFYSQCRDNRPQRQSPCK